VPLHARWQAGDSTFGHTMQTSDFDLLLSPRPQRDRGLIDMLAASLPEIPCASQPRLAVLGNLSIGDVALRLARARPCFLTSDGRSLRETADWSAVLLERLPPGAEEPGWVGPARRLLAGGAFRRVAAVPGVGGELVLYVRSAAAEGGGGGGGAAEVPGIDH